MPSSSFSFLSCRERSNFPCSFFFVDCFLGGGFCCCVISTNEYARRRCWHLLQNELLMHTAFVFPLVAVLRQSNGFNVSIMSFLIVFTEALGPSFLTALKNICASWLPPSGDSPSSPGESLYTFDREVKCGKLLVKKTTFEGNGPSRPSVCPNQVVLMDAPSVPQR